MAGMEHRFNASLMLSREDLDFQLSPSRSAKDAGGVLDWLVQQTQAAVDDPDLIVLRDVAYGVRPRQKLDVFRPQQITETPMPCLVFLHGGFWQEGDKSVAGFAAQSFAQMGWAWISVGYTLTPEVSLSALTREVYEAVHHVREHARDWGIDPLNIVLAGHSAGGHLAASVLTDTLGTGIAPHVAGAVLISGVYELAPIAASYVNDLARMSPDEVHDLSPARATPVSDAKVHLLIGGDEPEAFHIQTLGLRDLWGRALSDLTHHIAQGRDHFDVLQEMTDPASPTRRAISTMA